MDAGEVRILPRQAKVGAGSAADDEVVVAVERVSLSAVRAVDDFKYDLHG
jgi:hypothetical protein